MASRSLPSLDGLRAVSIGLVLLAHLRRTAGFWPLRGLSVAGDLGNLGVRVFFVISGFLITHLLLKEHERTGTISLRDFYLRRTLRIFPAFYAFLAIVWAGARLGYLPLQPGDLLHAATYTMNYHQDRSWYVGHLWSLAVEEQFYLLWPATLALLGPRRGLWVVVGALVAAPLTRVGTWLALPRLEGSIGEAFPTIMDAIAAGCLLALARGWLAERGNYLRWQASPAFWLAPLAVVLANATGARVTLFGWLLGETIMNLSIALMIDHWLRHPGGLTGRILNYRLLSAVGVLSYSLYLWQQPFLFRQSGVAVQRFPLNLALAFTAAASSYLLIERPFLRLKERFTPKRASRAEPLA